MQTIYVVEERSKRKDSCRGFKGLECADTYFATTEEKAREWCKQQRCITQEIENRLETWYWYMVFEIALDSDPACEKPALAVYSWDGEELDGQPLNGYDKPHVKPTTW